MNLHNITRTYCVAAFAALWLIVAPLGVCYADPACDSQDGSPWVCVDFGAGTPDEGVDFRFNFFDPDNVGVELLTGDPDWVIYSQVSENNTNPANLGDITLDTSGSDDFEVTIANGANPGAVDVGLINLTDAGWTGFSSIEGGEITGDLTGGLVLQAESGSGGDISGTFTIGGDVSGDITVPKISGTLDIDGALSSDIDVTVEIDGGTLFVHGAVSSAAVITIADMSNASGTPRVNLGGESATVAGDLVLLNGLPAGFVDIIGELTSLGPIDLNGENVAGRLRLGRGGAGSITNGGDVSYQVWLTGGQMADTYSGTATFRSVSGFVQAGSLGYVDGTINVTGRKEAAPNRSLTVAARKRLAMKPAG